MEAAKDADFIACLALHQHKRDIALGLNHVSQQTRGLLWYYNHLQTEIYREQQKILLKAFHYGVVKGARKRIGQIKRTLTHDTPIDEARKLYREALSLQETIELSTKVING